MELINDFLGERVQSRYITDEYALPPCLYDALQFTGRKQTAYSEQRGARHLGKFFTRKVHLDVPVRMTSDAREQAHQLAGNAGANALGGNLAKPFLQLHQVLMQDTDDIPVQN